MSEKSQRICVGEISTAHGVRGLVKVRVYGDDPQTLQKYGPLHTDETGNKTYTLTLKHKAGGIWIAAVEGIMDRNAAEPLRGTKLWLDRDKLPDLEDGFYHEDLKGMDVVTQDGTDLGKVIGVENFGASDLLDVKPKGKPSFYVPFVDEYILSVDEDARVITIDLPEGLLE